MILNLRRTAIVSAFCLLASGSAATAVTAGTAAGAVAPPQRVLGQSTLSYFRVTLVATRGPSAGGGGTRATVTAAGYERSGSSWRLLSRKRVGQRDQWSWNTVQVCSLTVTQLYNAPEGPTTLQTATVSLLASYLPGGCSKGYQKDWVVP